MAIVDILDDDLKKSTVRLIVSRIFDGIEFETNRASSTRQSKDRSKTPGDSKNLSEFYLLVKRAIDDMEKRAGVICDGKINFTEENPDKKSESESITFTLMSRRPGMVGQGHPFGNDRRNLQPLPRENKIDPENPKYKIQVNGYYYDNLVRFTCWARTNKEVNARALWFEDLMMDYNWWFKLQGIQRVLFWERTKDKMVEIDGNKWYGRPLDFFVRTEKIVVFSEKRIEEILLRLSINTDE